jgi:hypothetical protein
MKIRYTEQSSRIGTKRQEAEAFRSFSHSTVSKQPISIFVISLFRINGRKVSLHYFQDAAGKIFDFEIKYWRWS